MRALATTRVEDSQLARIPPRSRMTPRVKVGGFKFSSVVETTDASMFYAPRKIATPAATASRTLAG